MNVLVFIVEFLYLFLKRGVGGIFIGDCLVFVSIDFFVKFLFLVKVGN